MDRALKSYKLDALLLAIGTLIRSMFERGSAVGQAILEERVATFVRRGPVTMTAWHLSDLAYLAIQNTHDFAQHVARPPDVVELMNLFHERDGKLGSQWLDALAPEDKTLAFAVGFSQKEFWYQELQRIRAEFNRQVEMLEVLAPRASDNLRIDAVCQQATGFDLRTFRKLLFAMYAIGGKKTDVTNLTSDGSAERIEPSFTTANVRKAMEYYTADYQQLRKNALGENAFFAWPIVRTASGRVVVVNEYFLARKISDGPYWILRDHYMTREDRSKQEAFVRQFGELFDLYFEELLSFYFPRQAFNRVVEQGNSRKADWVLRHGGRVYVIELKSSLLPLAARKNYPDPALIRAYLPKLAEGVIQLDQTAQAIGDGPTPLKILVHYEPLFISDGVLRPLAVDQCASRLSSTERIFFSDLEDIENLFQLMHDAPTVAEVVIREKMDMESRPDAAAIGREFRQVLQRHAEIKVNRFVHERINHYSTYVFPNHPA
ncbi:MAG: hypothetical protein ABSG17_21940 [Spirochaetia bacterium]